MHYGGHSVVNNISAILMDRYTEMSQESMTTMHQYKFEERKRQQQNERPMKIT